MNLAKIGALEVKTFGTGPNRTKVIRLPGHEFDIEHFFPQNHKPVLTISRAVFIQSNIGDRPEFVKKRSGSTRMNLALLSEMKLAAYINSLNIEGITAEQPLAVIYTKQRKHAVFRKVNAGVENWDSHGAKALEIKRILSAYGITPVDSQWFRHPKGVTLFDLERFEVSDELRKKLKLRYNRN